MTKKRETEAWRTPSVEDFLKAIYHLQQDTDAASTTQLANELGIAPSSVTDMIKRLAGLKEDEAASQDIPEPLIEYTPYHGARLNEAGQKIALNVIRRHRLIELLLYRLLGYAWDEVHQEAERLEHVVSPLFVERLAEVLGNPDSDPHGDPIPSDDGVVPRQDLVSLSTLKAGQGGEIVQIQHQEPETLRSLAQLGLMPERPVTVTDHNALNDTITLQIGSGKTEVISTRVAETILVRLSQRRQS